MKRENEKVENSPSQNGSSKIISVVVHSVNKNYAKLLVVSEEVHEQMMRASKSKNKKECFAMFADADMFHNLIGSGYGSLDKKQFEKLIKENYNSKMQYGRAGKLLKGVDEIPYKNAVPEFEEAEMYYRNLARVTGVNPTELIEVRVVFDIHWLKYYNAKYSKQLVAIEIAA